MIKCDSCSNKFDPGVDPAALVFSPPEITKEINGRKDVWIAQKFHVCTDCWPKLLKWMKRPR